jgi:hypothetical protein
MSTDSIPGLGPRTEVPKLNPKADFAAAQLSPQEGFVLSRVDGRTSLGEICLITGLGEAATVAALQKLKAALLIVTNAPMSELPPDIAPPSAAKAATFGGAARGPGATDHAGAPTEGNAANGAAGARAGRLQGGRGPDVEVARPLPPLRDDEIDPAVLADGKDLSEEVKRRILAFHKRLPVLDYFDRLEVDPEVDRQAIRRAYFRLSKEFHPDRYYGKDLGSYRDKLSDVFKAISEAFATLADDSQRQAYVLKLRDSAATAPSSRRPKPR